MTVINTIDLVNNTNQVYAEKAKQTMGSTELSSDSFMRLLLAQMQNQDPLKPMDSSQLTTQQAQLSSVSELQKINKNLSGSNQMMQASSLIGKDVTVTDPNDSSSTISGRVSEAKINSTGAAIVIDGKAYDVGAVQSIKDTASQSSATNTAS